MSWIWKENSASIEHDMKSATGEVLETAALHLYPLSIKTLNSKTVMPCESEVTGVLKGLGFSEEDFSHPINTLSGGQKTRVALGKLLLLAPDVLLSGRANQPSGYGINRLVGNISAQL